MGVNNVMISSLFFPHLVNFYIQNINLIEVVLLKTNRVFILKSTAVCRKNKYNLQKLMAKIFNLVYLTNRNITQLLDKNHKA